MTSSSEDKKHPDWFLMMFFASLHYRIFFSKEKQKKTQTRVMRIVYIGDI